MSEIPHPLFISSRLMAAYRIEGIGTLHLLADHIDAEHRVVYRYVIEDASGVELDTGADLSSGSGAPVDYLATMETLLGFLEHAAESGDDPDGNLFNPATTEWAAQHSDELTMHRLDLDTDPSNHENCSECENGNDSPHLPVWES